MTNPDKPTAARELADCVRDLSSHLSVPACWQPEVANRCGTVRPNGCERCLCGEWQERMRSALSRYDAAREVCDTVTEAGRRLVACIKGTPASSLVGGRMVLGADFVDRLVEFRAALEGGDDADA